MKKNIVVLYVPVIHKGYKDFLADFEADTPCYVVARDLQEKVAPYLRKECRALEPENAVCCIRSFGFTDVVLLTEKNIQEVIQKTSRVYIPDEDVLWRLRDMYFPRTEVVSKDIFLRWDQKNVVTGRKPVPKQVTTLQDFAHIEQAFKFAQKSTNWWRQVGAVIYDDKDVVCGSYNKAYPTDYNPWIVGDPRNALYKGVHIDYSTTIHAEAAAIGLAARRGICLEGLKIFVTTFPCPTCAKLIVASGIRQVVYVEGYSMLDSESIFRDADVLVRQVVMPSNVSI